LKVSLFKIALIAGSVVLAGSALAQSAVGFYFNGTGNIADNGTSDIIVSANSTVTLSVYYTVSAGFGNELEIATMLGYTTATSTGSGATLANNGVSFTANTAGDTTKFVWATAPYAAGNNPLTSPYNPIVGGGNGTGTRPAGIWADTSGTFSDVGATKLYDVKLDIGNLAPNTVIPVNILAANSANAGFYNSYVQNANFGYSVPSGDFIRNLKIAAVPEPTTLAVLGLGALALRRRRRS
jgi:hypothetical protein